jgi:hypothetical protein
VAGISSRCRDPELRSARMQKAFLGRSAPLKGLLEEGSKVLLLSIQRKNKIGGLGSWNAGHLLTGLNRNCRCNNDEARLLEQIPICLFPKNFQAAYLTFIQSWDAQHIAEILYLKYFYVVVYSDGG